MSDPLELLLTRRSVREYKDQPIPREILERLIDAARLAPTAFNEQPWEFVVVTERSSLQSLGKAVSHGPFVARAAACIVVLARLESKFAIQDACAASTTLQIAAWALGIGSCWVAVDDTEQILQVAGIVTAPDEVKAVCLVPLGYPTSEALKAPRAPKRPLDSILHWERVNP